VCLGCRSGSFAARRRATSARSRRQVHPVTRGAADGSDGWRARLSRCTSRGGGRLRRHDRLAAEQLAERGDRRAREHSRRGPPPHPPPACRRSRQSLVGSSPVVSRRQCTPGDRVSATQGIARIDAEGCRGNLLAASPIRLIAASRASLRSRSSSQASGASHDLGWLWSPRRADQRRSCRCRDDCSVGRASALMSSSRSARPPALTSTPVPSSVSTPRQRRTRSTSVRPYWKSTSRSTSLVGVAVPLATEPKYSDIRCAVGFRHPKDVGFVRAQHGQARSRRLRCSGPLHNHVHSSGCRLRSAYGVSRDGPSCLAKAWRRWLRGAAALARFANIPATDFQPQAPQVSQ